MPGNGYGRRVARLEARVCCQAHHVQLVCVRCDFITWAALTREERARLHGYLRRLSTARHPPAIGDRGPCPWPGCGVRVPPL